MTATTYILSVGGSLVVPQKIDIDFLKNFKTIIEQQVQKGKRFFIVTGGGGVAREYQAALRAMGFESENLDKIGIEATRMNAQLLKIVFGSLANPIILTNPDRLQFSPQPIVIAAGWKPGWSTDYVAVYLAKKLGVNKVTNLSNIDYVYDRDPQKDKNAQPFSKMSWAEFRNIAGGEWQPGLNLPFDPIASKLAEESNISVVIINGKNFKNLEAYLNAREFIGTIIS